jgi:fimbrial chaperone protein
MRVRTFTALATAFLLSLSTSPRAASLQVSPVSVEVPAPGAAATITLRNEGSNPLNAQIRVFRWSQVNGG